MSSDVKNLMDELDKLVTGVLASLEENKPITIHHKRSNMEFDVTTNISIRLGLLESLGPLSYDKLKDNEPLVDILEDDNNIKIIAMIPGIKKEDIETDVRDGFIDIKIRKGNDLIHRTIACNVKPNQVTIKSLSYNNSVLEIVFSKRKQ